MKKTFYSVRYYSGRGNTGFSEKWYDSYEKAKEISKLDGFDSPVKHTYTKEKSIKEAEELVINTEMSEIYAF